MTFIEATIVDSGVALVQAMIVAGPRWNTAQRKLAFLAAWIGPNVLYGLIYSFAPLSDLFRLLAWWPAPLIAFLFSQGRVTTWGTAFNRLLTIGVGAAIASFLEGEILIGAFDKLQGTVDSRGYGRGRPVDSVAVGVAMVLIGALLALLISGLLTAWRSADGFARSARSHRAVFRNPTDVILVLLVLPALYLIYVVSSPGDLDHFDVASSESVIVMGLAPVLLAIVLFLWWLIRVAAAGSGQRPHRSRLIREAVWVFAIIQGTLGLGAYLVASNSQGWGTVKRH